MGIVGRDGSVRFARTGQAVDPPARRFRCLNGPWPGWSSTTMVTVMP
jgi:hypothetical protein